MSTPDSDQKQAWAEKLSKGSIDDHVEALRQISSHDSVSGLTASIVALAGSRDDEVRMWAAEALESAVQPQSCEALILMRLLESAADGEICYWAATMLGRLGSGAALAAGALEACLRESMYLPARERCAWALGQLGPAATIAVESLREAAETAPPRLQTLATEALAAIESAAGNTNESDGVEEAAA